MRISWSITDSCVTIDCKSTSNICVTCVSSNNKLITINSKVIGYVYITYDVNIAIYDSITRYV